MQTQLRGTITAIPSISNCPGMRFRSKSASSKMAPIQSPRCFSISRTRFSLISGCRGASPLRLSWRLRRYRYACRAVAGGSNILQGSGWSSLVSQLNYDFQRLRTVMHGFWLGFKHHTIHVGDVFLEFIQGFALCHPASTLGWRTSSLCHHLMAEDITFGYGFQFIFTANGRSWAARWPGQSADRPPDPAGQDPIQFL